MVDPEKLLFWGYFPVAFVLGGLHALEPGHAKTLTATYLIGIKGTIRDAMVLGVSVAATHSVVVIGLATIAVFSGIESLSERALAILHVVSAIIVIGIGIWMLGSRLFRRRHSGHSDCGHGHHHDLPQYAKEGGRPTLLQIVSFGVAGGMLPCPASVTVMMLALATGKALAGLAAVLGFSLGLAVALVGVGMAVVLGVRRIERNRMVATLFRYAPITSALLVIASGIVALVIG